ncbi:MAG: HlyD family efflux transporter periplasmic adaptor subunit [Magnetococcales bacterium]|nr:HlyD family efflux transporter periplasmic adaptor subunit [Magnetococcales bacterium]
MIFPALLLAHGDEDHEAKKPSATASIAASQPTGLGSGGQGERFEVVVTPDAAGGTQLFLADVVSNVPVAGAVIEVETSDATSPWKGRAEPTRQEGVYRLAWTPPAEASLEMTLVVTVGEVSDLLLVRFDTPNVQVQPSVPPRTAWSWSKTMSWSLLLIPGVVVLLVVVRKMAAKEKIVAGGLLLALTLVPSFVWSHGGEEHGDSAKESSPAGVTSGLDRTIALPKSVQFLLQMRTSVAEPREVADTLRLVGRVIPDPTGYARIQPSALSRIGYDPDLPSPVAGQWVKQGDALAVLNPILSIGERTDQRLSLMRAQRPAETAAGREMVLAPIDGQITDVHIVPGEVVTETAVLAEIINPKRIGGALR